MCRTSRLRPRDSQSAARAIFRVRFEMGSDREIFQKNAFCAANAWDFCNGDPEGKNRDVAIGHRMADSSERLKVERTVSSGQQFGEKIPEFGNRVLANRDRREMPHPRDERGDVVGGGLVLCFFSGRRQQQRLAARSAKHRCGEYDLHGFAFLCVFQEKIQGRPIGARGRILPRGTAGIAARAACRSSRRVPSWPDSNRPALSDRAIPARCFAAIASDAIPADRRESRRAARALARRCRRGQRVLRRTQC